MGGERLCSRCGLSWRKANKACPDWHHARAHSPAGMLAAPPAWTDADEQALRAEMERRFRERTPPRNVMDALADTRVGRGEMRSWATEARGKAIPELDTDLGQDRARWYRRMAVRVVKAQDPEALERVRARFKGSPVWCGAPKRTRRRLGN